MASKRQQGGDHAGEVLRRLDEAYPEARVELRFGTPLELLVATILSAQCTDRRVNEVTKTLFVDCPNALAYAGADLDELEESVRSTGFFRQKAKNIKACCTEIVERHGGEVPSAMDELTPLAGVGRKTASVLLTVAFDTPAIAAPARNTTCDEVVTHSTPKAAGTITAAT